MINVSPKCLCILLQLEGKVGRVGDRTILIESIGEQGKPIMEIFQTIGTRTDKVDRIIYMD